MSSPHALRPIFYRTARPWWQRLRAAIAVLVVVTAVALGATWLIARLHVTEAQLSAAHAQGMSVGMKTCPGL